MKTPRLSTRSCLKVFFIMLVALTGCAKLFDPGPPPAFFVLNPELDRPAQPSAHAVQLAVSMPSADNVLSTDHIVASYSSGEVRFWGKAAWANPTPALLQRIFVESFESKESVTAMPADAPSFLPEYRLVTDLRQFAVHIENGKPTTVDVQITAHIMDLRSGKSIGYLDSNHSASVASNSFESVVAAYNSATSSTVKEVTNWSAALITGKAYNKR